MPDQARPLTVDAGGVALSGESSGGEGQTFVLAHGLTATRRYVVMGSSALQRCGHRVLAYDARGHGRSTAAPARAYGYEHLVDDLLAVLDAADVERATIVGASMGAHTAVRFALTHPQRVAGLALVTPAFDPEASGDENELDRWDALAHGLREGGVDGFVAAYDLDAVPEAWRATVETVLRQRLSAHKHPDAVADALEVVPRSRPFQELSQLEGISVPTLVVASRDEADPGHPLEIGERYAQTIPGATLAVEDAGPPAKSPIAWQGGQLSKLIAQLAQQIANA
jgi:pimeloyl-ACP methyl ester carboxylesterase